MPDMDSYPSATAVNGGDRVLLRQTDTDGSVHTRRSLFSQLLSAIFSSTTQLAAWAGQSVSPTISATPGTDGTRGAILSLGSGAGANLNAGLSPNWQAAAQLNLNTGNPAGGEVGAAQLYGASAPFTGAISGGTAWIAAGLSSNDIAVSAIVPTHVYAGGTADFTKNGDIVLDTASVGFNGPPGVVRFNGDASIVVVPVRWKASDPGGQVVFTATRKLKVTNVIGRPEVNNGSAATLVPVKAPSGVALSAGTALTGNSMDLNGGTVAANQTLSVVSGMTLDVGDSVGLQTSGTIAASVGSLSIHLAPI